MTNYRRSMAEELQVVHDADNSRYVLERDGVEIGQTVYDSSEPGLIEFVHTEIDPALQEHGLASVLVTGALDDVRATSTDRVAATCPYVSVFLRRHPEYSDLTSR